MKLKKIIRYLPLIFSFLTFMLTFLININVCYFGDDYYYLTYTNGTFLEFINNHINHYAEINGRIIVHILVTIFLWFNLYWWKILNSLMLAGIVYFGGKLASYKVNNDYSLLYSSIIFFCGISLIDILVARESIYWLTGSFNYVYPILMLLIYWYMLLKFCDTGKNFYVLLLFSLLASATVEQVAMMTFGLTILTLFNFILDNNKISKRKIITIIFIVTLGTFSVILSPSIFIRYALESSNELSLSFLETFKAGMRYLINVYIFSDSLFIYNIITVIASLLIIYSYKDKLYENNKTIIDICKNIIIVSIPIIFINRFVFGDLYLFSALKLLSAIYMLLTYLLVFIVLPIILYNKNIIANWTILPIIVILLIGSQTMIIFSPVYGYRNLLFRNNYAYTVFSCFNI